MDRQMLASLVSIMTLQYPSKWCACSFYAALQPWQTSTLEGTGIDLWLRKKWMFQGATWVQESSSRCRCLPYRDESQSVISAKLISQIEQYDQIENQHHEWANAYSWCGCTSSLLHTVCVKNSYSIHVIATIALRMKLSSLFPATTACHKYVWVMHFSYDIDDCELHVTLQTWCL